MATAGDDEEHCGWEGDYGALLSKHLGEQYMYVYIYIYICTQCIYIYIYIYIIIWQ